MTGSSIGDYSVVILGSQAQVAIAPILVPSEFSVRTPPSLMVGLEAARLLDGINGKRGIDFQPAALLRS
jgi:hypothetical protein